MHRHFHDGNPFMFIYFLGSRADHDFFNDKESVISFIISARTVLIRVICPIYPNLFNLSLIYPNLFNSPHLSQPSFSVLDLSQLLTRRVHVSRRNWADPGGSHVCVERERARERNRGRDTVWSFIPCALNSSVAVNTSVAVDLAGNLTIDNMHLSLKF